MNTTVREMDMPVQPVGADLARVISTAFGLAIATGFAVGVVLAAGGMLLEKIVAF